MNETKNDYVFKIVVIGESNVGKTNLVLQFGLDIFTPQTRPTIGIELRVKTVEVDGKSVKVQIWDTAGQEKYRAITKHHYRGANGALILYDITSLSSYNSVQKWIDELKMYSNDKVIVMLIGNKCDLISQRTVLENDAQNFANEKGFFFLEMSAKEATNVKEAFMLLVKELTAQISNQTKVRSNCDITPDKGIKILDETIKKNGCCKK